MRERLRQIWIVAWFDFFDSVRSRKSLALLALALLGSIAASGAYSKAIHVAERSLAGKLGVAKTDKVGAMADALWQSDELRDDLGDMIGDKTLVGAIVAVPPVAFFAAWLGFFILPLLIVLTSSDATSAEVATGSARFALFRCDRLSWAIGKLAGQAILMALGILVGALGVLLVAATVWHSWHPARTILWMARFGVRVWIFGFSYLGLAVGISLSTRSVNLSRGLGLVGLFAVGGVSQLLWHYESHAPVVFQSLEQLVPRAHAIQMWQPSLVDRLPSIVMLLVFGVACFALGYARFARRDR